MTVRLSLRNVKPACRLRWIPNAASSCLWRAKSKRLSPLSANQRNTNFNLYVDGTLVTGKTTAYPVLQP
jgi:hypothetical protein